MFCASAQKEVNSKLLLVLVFLLRPDLASPMALNRVELEYDDTKERLAAACPALPDAEKQQGGIHLHFIDADGSFTLERTEEISQLYFPLASEDGLKSCVSPDLGGDAKLDQETFLLEPVSVENLHNNRSTRNFWLVGEDGTAFSLTGASEAQQAVKFTPAQEDSRLTVGFM